MNIPYFRFIFNLKIFDEIFTIHKIVVCLKLESFFFFLNLRIILLFS